MVIAMIHTAGSANRVSGRPCPCKDHTASNSHTDTAQGHEVCLTNSALVISTRDKSVGGE